MIKMFKINFFTTYESGVISVRVYLTCNKKRNISLKKISLELLTYFFSVCVSTIEFKNCVILADSHLNILQSQTSRPNPQCIRVEKVVSMTTGSVVYSFTCNGHVNETQEGKKIGRALGALLCQ